LVTTAGNAQRLARLLLDTASVACALPPQAGIQTADYKSERLIVEPPL